MFSSIDQKSPRPTQLDTLDRLAIGYIALPLIIFLAGWLVWWAALPLLACTGYALRAILAPLPASAPAPGSRPPITRLQLSVAVGVGCAWTVCAGAGHLLYANADWFVRDAVLHDLVASRWPVGYGTLDGQETVLRAPVAFYLPAALVGKWGGLLAADAAMGLWTALGASLFLLQVLSLIPPRGKLVALAVAVVVLFSGFDILGNILDIGPRFVQHWNIAKHLEWWAGSYQYSSMTTQLFWVPNHALASWLVIGLMSRNMRFSSVDALLPIVLAAAALWSPLSAVGLLPFAAWKAYGSVVRERRFELLDPRVWLPALLVGGVTASYLILDSGRIAKGMTVSNSGAVDLSLGLLRQAQFFLLEAGFIGFAILVIHRSSEVVIALVVLALLPLAYLGPGNDIVMRASIPSLAVLTIGACLALARDWPGRNVRRYKIWLGCMLAIGAVTPIQEFARDAVLPSWPINTQATLIGVNCGGYPPHYVAGLGTQTITHLMKAPHRLTVEPILSRRSCANPAVELMWRGGLLND